MHQAMIWNAIDVNFGTIARKGKMTSLTRSAAEPVARSFVSR
jgi:hypothetical protein